MKMDIMKMDKKEAGRKALEDLDFFHQKPEATVPYFVTYARSLSPEELSEKYDGLVSLVKERDEKTSKELTPLTSENVRLYRDVCESLKQFNTIAEDYLQIMDKVSEVIADRYVTVDEQRREVPKEDYEMSLAERLKAKFGRRPTKSVVERRVESDNSWKRDEDVRSELRKAYKLGRGCVETAKVVLDKYEALLANDRRVDTLINGLMTTSNDEKYAHQLKEQSSFVPPESLAFVKTVQANKNRVLENYARLLG